MTPAGFTRTGDSDHGRPVYSDTTGRYRVAWHDPRETGALERRFGSRAGWQVLDLTDPFENPASDQFDPIYAPHRTLKAAAADIASRR